jgi:hypothetical protein
MIISGLPELSRQTVNLRRYLLGRLKMSDTKDVVDEDEAVQENIYQVSALVALLEQKGIITRQEFSDEVEGLKNRG